MLSFKTAKLTTEKDSTKRTKATNCKRDKLEEKNEGGSMGEYGQSILYTCMKMSL